MRKALIPMLASLVLCGAGALALVASNSHAQASPRKPVMVALLGGAPADFAPDPRQVCEDRYAGEVGRMAYLEARLHLNQAEQPLFAHWKEVRLDIAKRRAAECSVHIAGAGQDRADPVARMAQEEDMLKQRIADLEAERPVFATLYAALTPGQRESLSPRAMMGHALGPRRPGFPERGDFQPPPPPTPSMP